jgi:hypothetical protein
MDQLPEVALPQRPDGSVIAGLEQLNSVRDPSLGTAWAFLPEGWRKQRCILRFCLAVWHHKKS